MTVQELIEKLKKLPKDAEVRYATEKDRRGARKLYGINSIEEYHGWYLLQWKER